jgi:hypothetical protein
MKKLKKCRIGLIMILAMLLAIPVNNVGATSTTGTTTTSGSSMTVTVGTTNNAKAGDTVTVRLVGSNNPGISTLGIQLGYDDEYLTYSGAATWSDTIANNGIQMVTATTVDSKPVVNISAVFNSTYTSNENMVTLSFTVKRDYTDMSTYLTPSVREVTDSNLKDVTINWVYDPNAGLTTNSSQNLVPDDTTNSGTSSGNTSGTTTDGTTSGTTGGTTSGTTGSTTDGNTTTGATTNSGDGTTASSGTSGLTTTTTADGTVKKTTKSSVDNTPSTGAVDLTLVLGIVIAVFVGISGVCLYVLKKKNVA